MAMRNGNDCMCVYSVCIVLLSGRPSMAKNKLDALPIYLRCVQVMVATFVYICPPFTHCYYYCCWDTGGGGPLVIPYWFFGTHANSLLCAHAG